MRCLRFFPPACVLQITPARDLAVVSVCQLTSLPKQLAIVVGLLALFLFQCERLAYRTSATFDEAGHLGAGLSYWRNGDFRITTWNLFLMQRLLTLPLAFDSSPFPSIAEQDRLKRDPIAVGETYLFKMGLDHRSLLGRARMMNAAFGAVLGLLIFAWTRKVGGILAGVLALALYVLSPAVIAIASLVTIDVGAALWLNAAVWAYAWFLHAPSWRRAVLAGLVLGALLLTKFSALAYFALAGAIFLIGLALAGPQIRRTWRRILALHGIGLFVAWLAIWAFFGFRAAPGGATHPWGEMGQGTKVERAAQIARTLHLLPDPYAFDLRGFRLLVGKRYSFLHGEHRYGGSWDYFPITFGVKSTIAFLTALALAAIIAATHARRVAGILRSNFAHALPMLVMPLGFLGLCIASNLNIGFRHLLPALPGLFAVAGIGLAWLWHRSRLGLTAVVAIIGLATVEAVAGASHPHAYFNALAGGPMEGYRWLTDTSIDWGADLPEFATWEAELDRREPGVSVFLAHHGVDQIEAYGVRARNLLRPFTRADLSAGYYVFSVRLLWSATDVRAGPYTRESEQEYQALQTQPLAALDADARLNLRSLQLSRLATYCRHRPPDVRIGPVYFVFKLGPDDLVRALDAPFPSTWFEPPMRL